MGKTKIEWCDYTMNPWWGCVKVSPACTNCYAETFSKRVGQQVWGKDAERRFFGDKHWNEPLKWNRKAEKEGVRHRVFCASMADVFEEREDLDEQRDRLWDLIHDTPWLDWLLLTKRPENMISMAAEEWGDLWPANVWAGTTVENQKWADERIPHLLAVPAQLRFLSIEPLLGPVVITDYFANSKKGLDWIIAGGESGPGSRRMDLDWVRDIRDLCKGAQVAFFLKQKGAALSREMHCASIKGDDMAEFPEDLRVREWPNAPTRTH